MRIGVLYIVGSFKSGGTETQLVEILRRLDRERFAPYVLCLEKRGAQLGEVERLEVEIHETGFRRLASLRALRAFRSLDAWLQKQEIGIIHGFPFHGALYGALLKRRRPGLKLMVAEQAIYGLSQARYRLGRRWYYRFVDVITANCEAVRRAVATRDRIDPARIRVVHGGVDTDRFTPGVAAPRGPGGLPVIGCVGRLHPDKGQLVLARAVPLVLAEIPESRFLFIGDGPQRGELERLIGDMGIGDRVELLGDRRDVPRLLAELDLLVLPSTSEGFSNAALEGSACGIPVIASDAGGNPEIVVDGRTGRIFRNGDARMLAECVIDLLREPGRARTMGEAGRRRVEAEFPLPAMVRRHEILYEEMMRDGPGRLGGGRAQPAR
jgi:glycosyltransferase involved in cell wall biosynthesis